MNMFTKHINRLAIIAMLLSASACIHPKVNLHKQRLLDPMMDPAKTSGLQTSFHDEPMAGVEKGSVSGSGAVGASCPTCGG